MEIERTFYLHYRDSGLFVNDEFPDLTETGGCGILSISLESQTGTYETYTESEATSPSDT